VIPGGLVTITLILVLFSVWHASYALGARLTAAFFVITAVTSWLFEEVGVGTGLVYGAYRYTGALGPGLGSVPLLIPVAWFTMAYPSYMVANLIVDRRVVGSPGDRIHLLGLAFVGALVMTAWDLLADPILSGPSYHAWVWEHGGPYFGIPLQNFVGWLATTFVVFLLYRSLERSRPVRSTAEQAAAAPAA